MFKFLALLLLCVSASVQAQGALHDDLPLLYLEQAPADARDRPLVIFLHGYGSNEEDLFGLKDGLPADYTYLSVRAPQTVEEGSYQWFHKQGEGAYDGVTAELADSAKLIDAFVRQAVAKYHTRADRVFLVGFSQGAIMSYELGLRHPQAVRGIAALSGKILPVLRSQLKSGEGLEQLAIFIAHGTADMRLPYSDGSEADSLLRGLGLAPQFHAYPGIGHTISDTELQDLNRWLLSLNP
ncbi:MULTISPECIES: alpha/beta hydrolase [Pseudomonas]|uniref:alpha/beta hydrolase n=1 Tax=Pseudomonas TaxID=286 RepID=UPI0005AB6BCF|nr:MULTISPECIES: PHB depolymerase family esterase [Pseudomonas]AZD91645.1 phospholipase/carboxylesterase family protein [Pseudomonas chlororaphis subsp. aureofaciens]KAB0530760.1 phospholipase [Pseudomonas chlororaphis subsp. aureofaciens]TSD31970.1 phospholipase [Pseudomonas sp. ATCC 13985]WDG62995.1 PHB depolymerase family esterase [Pseudomonas chlororaphis]WDG68807.1 PHB depolymerase family esterase [Pseudomonas chlororaphis]